MHLGSLNGRSTCFLWTMDLFKSNSQLVLGDGGQFFRQFTGGPAGRINFCRTSIINDLPGGQVLCRNQGKMLGQGGRNGEVARRNDPELASLGSLFNLAVIARG